MIAIQRWLQIFGKDVRPKDSTLAHGKQSDIDSCGVYALNMIEHSVFGDQLLSSDDVVIERAALFNTLAQNYMKVCRYLSTQSSERL